MVGVSAATASNALAGKGRLSASMAARIRAAADALGYVPGRAGRALRTGRSGTIGLVVPDFASPLFPTFAQAVERAAKRRGYAVLVGDSMDSAEGQQAEIAGLVERGVDAIVVIPLRGEPVGTTPVPLAVIDSAAMPGNTVSSDHRQGGRMVAHHLLGLGHRKILVLEGWEHSTVARERVAGLVEAFAAAGAVLQRHAGAATIDGGRAAVAAGLAASVTAIAAAYDALAVGALLELSERGIRVPAEVSVTGFDDLTWGRIVTPSLTTVRQDLAAVADHAVAVATGESDERRLMPVELVVRRSSGPAPHPPPPDRP